MSTESNKKHKMLWVVLYVTCAEIWHRDTFIKGYLLLYLKEVKINNQDFNPIIYGLQKLHILYGGVLSNF